MRLDKYLSEGLFITRAESTSLLKKKVVKVNEVIITQGSLKIDSKDVVSVNDEEIHLLGDIFLMMNKPENCVCSLDERDGKSVYDLVPYKGVNPIGRLDKDTTGLLIFTSKGDIIHNVTSPKNKIEKEYLCKVKEKVENLDKLLEEREYSNGKRGSYLGKAERVEQINDNMFKIIITEGKFHEIKEMVKSINLTLLSLERIRIGEILLDPELERGQTRLLTEKEREYLLNIKWFIMLLSKFTWQHFIYRV